MSNIQKYILSSGWSICFHVHITLFANMKSEKRDFAQHAMVTRPNPCTGYRITAFILSLETVQFTKYSNKGRHRKQEEVKTTMRSMMRWTI